MPVTLPSLDDLRSSIRLLKQGRREQGLLLLATLLASGATLVDKLPKDLGGFLAPAHPDLVLGGLAGLLFAWLVVRLWRQALPRQREVVIRPSAIKGPRSFGPHPKDGELFLRLGRDHELGELLEHVFDDQVGLVVLMGESGAGKTSLLRSGLYHQLQRIEVPPIPCLYWEALPSDPAAGLLHALAQQLDEDPTPLSVTSLVSRLDATRRVLVLDQLEQLDPKTPAHAPLFDLLRQVGERRAPFRTTWIVCFRREFAAAWVDFEIAHPELRRRRMSLQRFALDRAKEVLATLAETVELTLDEALLDDLVRSAADHQEEVSPVDLGIGMLVLDELARSRRLSSLSLADYRFAGGSQGLLAGYLLDRLSGLAEEERRALLKALLLLVDLPNDQRVAGGQSLADLAAEADRPLARTASDLNDLVEARVLERFGPNGYRLQHERLIEPLRQLTGQLLAESDRARLLLIDAYRQWLQLPRASALLAGADLRLVLQHRVSLLLRQPEAAEFVRRSRVRRRWRRAAAAASAGIVIVGALAVSHALKISNDRSLLLGAGLPPELASQQGQLRSLHLSSQILTNLAWLHAPLTELEFSVDWMRELPALPSTLVRLTIHHAEPELLDRLPALPRLEEISLDTGESTLPALQGLHNLRKLTLTFTGYSPDVSSLSSLSALEELVLILPGVSRPPQSLPRLDRLKRLVVTGGSFEPRDLPQLEELTDHGPSDDLCPSGGQFFPKLKVLEIAVRPDLFPDLTCFSRLEGLRLRLSESADSIPTPVRQLVTSVAVDCNPSLDSLLQGLPRLTSLILTVGSDLCRPHLPQSLERLDVDLHSVPFPEIGDNLSRLPHLRDLSVIDGQAGQDMGHVEIPSKIVFPTPGLPLLKTLTLNTGLPSLASLKVYPALKELYLKFGTSIKSVKGFPALRELEVLELTGVTSVDLRQLPPLPRLRTLILNGASIKSLEGLPPTVRELSL